MRTSSVGSLVFYRGPVDPDFPTVNSSTVVPHVLHPSGSPRFSRLTGVTKLTLFLWDRSQNRVWGQDMYNQPKLYLYTGYGLLGGLSFRQAGPLVGVKIARGRWRHADT